MKKTVIITGASRGIGKEIAIKLGRSGYNIVVNYNSNIEAANNIVDSIVRNGSSAIAIKADISDANESLNLFNESESKFGNVDVLINNAGVMKLDLIKDFKDEDFQKVMDINIKGSFNMMRIASQKLNNKGSIVNLSTSAIGLGLPTYAVYNASKAAIEAMSFTFARELRGKQINVNCVAPGPTATDLFLKNKSDEQIEHFSKLPPLERLGKPEDIANIVNYLISEEGSWINGQVLRANGGII